MDIAELATGGHAIKAKGDLKNTNVRINGLDHRCKIKSNEACMREVRAHWRQALVLLPMNNTAFHAAAFENARRKAQEAVNMIVIADSTGYSVLGEMTEQRQAARDAFLEENPEYADFHRVVR